MVLTRPNGRDDEAGEQFTRDNAGKLIDVRIDFAVLIGEIFHKAGERSQLLDN
jgi:hypothetical protein